MEMLVKYVKNGLGSETGLSCPPKLWIQAVIAGAAGTAGLATSLYGGAQSAKAAKAAEERQMQQQVEQQAYYARRYAEDYLDTAAGQNLVRRAKEHAKRQWMKAAGAQAVAGGTAAASQQAKEAGNRMVGETIANIAASDQARKANVDNAYMQMREKAAQLDAQREQRRANEISRATSAASNAIMQGGAAVASAFGKTDLQGGSNNSSAKSPSVDGLDKVIKPADPYQDAIYDDLNVV